jgi:hypothetical protein
MGEAWLVWLGGVTAVAFLILLALAGYALVGAFLAVGIWLAARHAAAPSAREQVDGSLKHACTRLPFCECGPNNFVKPS